MKNIWNNTKAVLNTFLFLIICQGFYALALRHVFNQSLFIVFALAILFVFVLRKYFYYLSCFWLGNSYKKATSLILLKWFIPIFTFVFYSVPWLFMLIKDVWLTNHPNWAKVTIIILFTLLIFTWSFSVIKNSKIAYRAKVAFRNGQSKFIVDGEDVELSIFTDN
ncbi:MAG: hypothetical protein WCH52_11335 [Bacteroidota bacterium]